MSTDEANKRMHLTRNAHRLRLCNGASGERFLVPSTKAVHHQSNRAICFLDPVDEVG